MINPTLQEREDGFIISKAKSKEFPVFKKLVEELPDEIKQNYSPWMFKKNPNLNKFLKPQKDISVKDRSMFQNIQLMVISGKEFEN